MAGRIMHILPTKLHLNLYRVGRCFWLSAMFKVT